jgi:GNAT superfamily N-acetyltransferase
MATEIRAPHIDELASLREIERASGSLFASVGLDQVAEDEPASIETLAGYLAADRVWVICEADALVGYALVDVVDGLAHLEQLSVRPEFGRRGLGTALLAHVCGWARDQGRHAVTLTTFREVAWNAPFYARNGFRIIEEPELGPELRRVRDDEATHGLDPTIRVCMRRDL